MNNTKLYNHNRRTCENVINSWSNGINKVGVVQATGTGKSFVISECCKYFSGKDILILAPKIHILDNLRSLTERENHKVTYMTYTKLNFLSQADLEDLQPELIVLDEFHRCGSNAWGKAVNNLLDTYKNSKVLGTTATNIRYLDNYRDMAIEIFDNNLACDTNLIDAITDGILPMPTYITSLYSLDEEINNISKRLSKESENYATVVDKLDKMKDWNSSTGVPTILRKHLDGSINKFIVFCKNERHLNEVFNTVCGWFEQASILEDVKSYKVSFFNGEKNNRKALDDFKNGDSNSMHLLFSIDILNEGLHVDSAGVILLRETSSPTVFLQQIGRALSVGNTKKPIIFDFVNNFNSLKVGEFRNMLIDSKNRKKENDRESSEPVDFKLYDETRAIIDLFEEINALIEDNWDVRYKELCEYYEKNGHCTILGEDSEYSILYKWSCKQRHFNNQNCLSQDKIDKLNAIDFPWNLRLGRWMLNYNKLKDYYLEYGNTKVYSNYYEFLYNWCSTQRCNKSSLSDRQVELLNELNFKWRVLDEEFEEKVQELIEYKEVHGDLLVPRRYPENPKLANWVHRVRCPKDYALLSQEKRDALNEIGFIWNVEDHRWNCNFEELAKYYSETKDYYNQGDIRSRKSLIEWVARQRQYKRLNKLSPERIAKLESINFVFDVSSKPNK